VSHVILPDGELDQGDIIRRASLIRKAPALVDDPIELYETAVFVMSDGCEIDKPNKPELRQDTVHVAGIFPLNGLSKGKQGDVKRNRVFNVFYLAQDDVIPEDCFIDWRTLQLIDKGTLLAARHDGRYLCTITGDLRDEIAGRFHDFFFRHLRDGS
jgi:hypothetical protein